MSETPRLVQIAEFDRPHAGSFIGLISGLLRRADEIGWRPHVVLPERAGSTDWSAELAGFARVHLAPERVLASRLRRARWLESEFRARPGRLVFHTHFTDWDLAALLASYSPSVDRTHVFWHVHSALPKDPLVVARSTLKFGVLGRLAAGLICPAPNIALGVKQRLGPAGRVHFVPSALEVDSYPLANDAARQRARSELCLADDAHVLLHFGWHAYLKGTDFFLRMVAAMVRDDPRIVALVRGHEESSVRLAGELGISSCVRFQEPVPDASTLFAAADVVVQSSREEGMAYTVLEALSSGVPVVCTAIPGHAFIGDSVAACRLTSLSSIDLARATRAVLDQSQQRRRREAVQARDWIAEKLSVKAIARETFDLYEKALAMPAGGQGAAPRARRREPLAIRNSIASRRRRVIQLVDFGNENPGSFVPMLAAAASASRESGYTPEVVLGADAAGNEWIQSLSDSGARIRYAPAVGRDGMRRWLAELIEEEASPAILHTHFTTYDLAAAAAAATRRSGTDTRVIWHVHSALSGKPTVVARNLAKFGVVGRQVDAFVCPAPDLAESIAVRGAKADRIHFVPNGIDLSRFTPFDERCRAEAKAALSIPESVPVVLAFGWDWDVKGGELFVRATAALSKRIGPLWAAHVCSDPRGPELARRLGFATSLHQYSPVADVNKMYAAADVFVAPSRAEGGTPFAVLESLACNVPVVASDIPAHLYIAERVPGLRVSTRDPARFADAIEAALDGKGSDGGTRSSVAGEFSLSRWSSRMIEIYDEVQRGQ